MEIDFNAMDYGLGGESKGFRRTSGRSRVLLHEPERCAQCNGVYLSLYPLRSCLDHDGLDEI